MPAGLFAPVGEWLICEVHGGRLELSNRDEETGWTVKISLPAMMPAPNRSVMIASPNHGQGCANNVFKARPFIFSMQFDADGCG